MISEPQECRWQVNGLTLRGLRWGSEAAPAVLALHGWLDNAASFSRLAPLLEGFQVVALDLTGHGRSDHRSAHASYQIWDDLPEINAVLNELGWQQFDLIGHSRGGVISGLLAAAMPERIKHMVLLDAVGTAPLAESEFAVQLRKHLDDKQRLIARQPRVFSSEQQAISVREKGGLSPEAAQLIARRNLLPCEAGFCWSTDPRLTGASAVKLTQGHIEAAWRATTVPSLLLIAENGLPGLGDYAQQARQHMPDLQVEVMPGGHHFHLEQEAQQVAARIRDFLQEP